MNSMKQTPLLKDILENNTLFEVEEIDGKLEYKLDSNGEKIRICEIDEISYTETMVKEIANFPELTRISGHDITVEDYKYLSDDRKKNFIPLVSGTLEDNQVSGYVEKNRIIGNALSDSNVISWTRINGKYYFLQKEPVCTNDDSFVLKPFEEFDIFFLKISLTSTMQNENYSWTDKLGKNKLKLITIKIPKEENFNDKYYSSYELQKSIAMNIEDKGYQLDKLISYHETMIELKKLSIGSTLDDEFSNSSSNHVILDELIVEKSEKNINNETELVYSVTNSKGIIPESENERIQTSSDDKSNYKKINKFDYAFNPSRINVGSIGMLKYEEEGVVSPIYNVFSINKTIINPLYLSFYFKSNKFKKDVNRFVLNSVRPKLEIDDLKKFELYFIYDEDEEANKANQLKKIEELNIKIKNEEKHIKLHEGCIKLLQMKKEKILYIG